MRLKEADSCLEGICSRSELNFFQERNMKQVAVLYLAARGRGASYKGRSMSGSACGLYTSENAGMSSENYVRIIMAESLRFLEEGSSAPS